MTKVRQQKIEIYFKETIPDENKLYLIWEACKKYSRPQEIFRRMLTAGLEQMIKNNEMPQSVLSEIGIVPEIKKSGRPPGSKNKSNQIQDKKNVVVQQPVLSIDKKEKNETEFFEIDRSNVKIEEKKKPSLSKLMWMWEKMNENELKNFLNSSKGKTLEKLLDNDEKIEYIINSDIKPYHAFFMTGKYVFNVVMLLIVLFVSIALSLFTGIFAYHSYGFMFLFLTFANCFFSLSYYMTNKYYPLLVTNKRYLFLSGKGFAFSDFNESKISYADENFISLQTPEKIYWSSYVFYKKHIPYFESNKNIVIK